MPSPNAPQPDSRVVQANERTLLAWIRTSLALVTFGFVVARLGAWLNAVEPETGPSPRLSSTALGTCFVVLGLLVNILSLHRYRQVHRALRTGQEVPMDNLPAMFGWLVIVLSAVVAAYTFAGML
jgi:putative membrane protein